MGDSTKLLFIANVVLASLVLLSSFDGVEAIQSNQTCVPMPKDKRQIVCQCSRSLQLRCLYNAEILLMGASNLDATLRPVYYDEVSLERRADPDDSLDPSTNFAANRAKYAAGSSSSTNKFYIYFPNFELLSAPYVRITMSKFIYVPSWAFVGGGGSHSSHSFRQVESIVFELPNAYDFGIDKNAFSRVEVTDTLLFEGPFNEINVHTDAFRDSKINELIFGCYCVECEYFEGDCRVNFNQAAKPLSNAYRRSYSNNGNQKKSTSDERPLLSDAENNDEVKTIVKSIKMFGVEFNLNVDQLPGIEDLSRFEITNLKVKPSAPLYSLRSARTYPNLTEFYFKNNQLKQLNALNAFYVFTGLKVASFAQNLIERLDKDTFKFSNLKTLEELNLERNKIIRVERDSFGDNLVNLKVLNLNQNNIEKIDDKAFSSLEKLETLDLTRNRLNYLNENTFIGLKSLKNLLLSYNPFKKFDSTTFKHVGASLNRLDLISNSESDWFMFDNSDVCLLSYFKCDTQIYIDSDQRCNCFVKYVNFISTDSSTISATRDADLAANNGESIVWFKPCRFFDSPRQNLNRYFDEMNSFYEDLEINSGQLGVHGPPPRSQNSIAGASASLQQKTMCPKQSLQSCFPSSSSPFFSQSCLYRSFILNETKSSSFSPSFSSSSEPLEPSELSQPSEAIAKPDQIGPLVVNKAQQSNNKYQTRQAIIVEQQQDQHSAKSDEQASSDNSATSTSNQRPIVWKKYTIEDSISMIVIAIAIALLISIVSLFIGVYLIFKRKSFVYHAAHDLSYPHDER